jgi:hypothetical protein
MTTRGGQVVLKILAAALVGTWLALPAPKAIAQEAADAQTPPGFDYTNSGNCLLCHSDAARMKDHADFIGVAPAEIWSKLDKHSQSFLLLRDKSRQLTNQILGFDLRDAFANDELTSLSDDEKLSAKVQTVQSCLRCHATWPAGAVHPTGDRAEPVEELSRGVSCQACHGPAGEWVDAHAGKWWRRVSHESKSRLGFTNVRDSVVKAELCASCHVGSLKEERFVKHEWYAAGHPPLPGFELATFSSQMPVHWKPLAEKGDFAGRTEASLPVSDGKTERIVLRRRNIDIPDGDVKANYGEANFPTAKDAKEGSDPFVNLPRTQEVIVSGAVVLKTYVSLAGDYAEQAAAGKQAWPEFALYDCASCHHELRRREGLAERPARRGPPGRPPIARWPTALLGLTEGQPNELKTSFRGLDDAFTERPFGNPKKIAAAARKVMPQLEALCQELRGEQFDEGATAEAIQALKSPEDILVDRRDYATARQLAWAIRELRKDQERIPYGFDIPLSDEQQQARQRIDSLFRRDSRDELLLTLPAGQDRSIVNDLPAFLQAMGEFDAQWFAERLKAIPQ